MDDADDNPNNVHNNNNTISEWEAGVSLAKAIMGAGSFALPWAFSKMGYVAGPIFMTMLLTMSVYSMQLLVQCCVSLRQKRKQEQEQLQLQQPMEGQTTCTMPPSPCCFLYVDVARLTFGVMGARCAYVASMLASIGVCGSYLVFIAANLKTNNRG